MFEEQTMAHFSLSICAQDIIVLRGFDPAFLLGFSHLTAKRGQKHACVQVNRGILKGKSCSEKIMLFYWAVRAKIRITAHWKQNIGNSKCTGNTGKLAWICVTSLRISIILTWTSWAYRDPVRSERTFRSYRSCRLALTRLLFGLQSSDWLM